MRRRAFSRRLLWRRCQGGSPTRFGILDCGLWDTGTYRLRARPFTAVGHRLGQLVFSWPVTCGWSPVGFFLVDARALCVLYTYSSVDLWFLACVNRPIER